MKLDSKKIVLGVVMSAVMVLAGVSQSCKSTEKTEVKSMSSAFAIDEVPQISVKGGTPSQNGRYIVAIAGCNDCHTAGYMATNGNIPESDWMCGDSLGWQGPWGTTYATNLRLLVQGCDEDTFVKTNKARQIRPPMPWSSLHHMNETDLRAVYAYLKAIGPKGEKVPDYCPPGVEPKTPYLSLMPIMPKGMTPTTQPTAR